MWRWARGGALGLCALGVAACSQPAPQLINPSRTQTTPDEFAILPGKPIEMPADMTALPPPSPLGGPNRTDPTPEADAVAALGGNPARLERDGQSPDAALLRQAGRYGTDPDIRTELAVEDLEFRRENRGRVLERWFNRNRYWDVYERDSLNQYDELERYRRSGARVSNPPPRPPES